MKKIHLTQGKFALVDDADYKKLKKYKWFAQRKENGMYYAATMMQINGKRIAMKMHRFIMDANDDVLIDHADMNGLNNQKNNLRFSSKSENQRNRGKQKNNTSGFKGVYFHKRSGKWTALIGIDNRLKHIGVFYCPIEAARAYNAAAIKYHGEFAKLNEIPA